MLKEFKTHSRSDDKLRKIYAFKTWQMFTMMKEVIENMDQEQRTGIDQKMLDLANRFRLEESYAYQQDIPIQIARELI